MNTINNTIDRMVDKSSSVKSNEAAIRYSAIMQSHFMLRDLENTIEESDREIKREIIKGFTLSVRNFLYA
jgi:hypothetical protein